MYIRRPAVQPHFIVIACLDELVVVSKCLVSLLNAQPGFMGTSPSDVMEVTECAEKKGPKFLIKSALKQTKYYVDLLNKYRAFQVSEKGMGSLMNEAVAKTEAGEKGSIGHVLQNLGQWKGSLRDGATDHIGKILYIQLSAACGAAGDDPTPDANGVTELILLLDLAVENVGVLKPDFLKLRNKMRRVQEDADVALRGKKVDTAITEYAASSSPECLINLRAALCDNEGIQVGNETEASALTSIRLLIMQCRPALNDYIEADDDALADHVVERGGISDSLDTVLRMQKFLADKSAASFDVKIAEHCVKIVKLMEARGHLLLAETTDDKHAYVGFSLDMEAIKLDFKAVMATDMKAFVSDDVQTREICEDIAGLHSKVEAKINSFFDSVGVLRTDIAEALIEDARAGLCLISGGMSDASGWADAAKDNTTLVQLQDLAKVSLNLPGRGKALVSATEKAIADQKTAVRYWGLVGMKAPTEGPYKELTGLIERAKATKAEAMLLEHYFIIDVASKKDAVEKEFAKMVTKEIDTQRLHPKILAAGQQIILHS